MNGLWYMIQEALQFLLIAMGQNLFPAVGHRVTHYGQNKGKRLEFPEITLIDLRHTITTSYHNLSTRAAKDFLVFAEDTDSRFPANSVKVGARVTLPHNGELLALPAG